MTQINQKGTIRVLHGMLVLPISSIQKAPGEYAKDFTLENLHKFIIRKQHLRHDQDINLLVMASISNLRHNL